MYEITLIGDTFARLTPVGGIKWVFKQPSELRTRADLAIPGKWFVWTYPEGTIKNNILIIFNISIL